MVRLSYPANFYEHKVGKGYCQSWGYLLRDPGVGAFALALSLKQPLSC